MHIIIHTDGGSRGNPGPAASAFTIHNSQNELLHEEKKFLGETTNNVAEYTALIMALEWLSQNEKRLAVDKVDVLMDSELVVKQMKGEYKIKDTRLQTLAQRARATISHASAEIVFVYIPRAKNSKADFLVNAAMDAELGHKSSTGN